MDNKILKLKERILVSIIVILILLIPISLLFEKKPAAVQVTNFDILKMNDSSQKLSFSLVNIEKQKLECTIDLKFFKDSILIKEEKKNVGVIDKGETKSMNFVVNFPEGKTVLKMKPICGQTYNFP